MELTAARLVQLIYRWLLHLYPPAFRGEFAEEMEDVFAQLVSESQGRGSRRMAATLLRELADLPSNLLRLYWQALQPREDKMNQGLSIGQMLDDESIGGGADRRPGAWQPEAARPTWRQVALAAAPLLLPLLFTAIPQLLVLSGLATWGSRLITVLNIIFGVIAIGCLLAALVVAWREKWPAWYATWYLYFWGLVFIPTLWLASLLEDESWFADIYSEMLFFFLLPMLIAAVLYWVARRSPLKSLLAVTPLLVLIWLPQNEFVPDHIEVPVVIFGWLVAALSAALVLRLGDWRAGLWLLLVASALIGLPYAYIGIYYGGMLPFSAAGPSLLEVMRSFSPYYLLASTLIIGPLLAACYRVVGRQAGRGGEICYHLALFGILLVLGAALGSFFFESDGRLLQVGRASASWVTLLGWLGLLLFLLSAAVLGWLAIRRHASPGWVQFVSLSLLILCLPLVLLLPVMTSGWGRLQGFIGALGEFYNVVPSLDFVIGFIWLLLAGWLLTRRPSPPKMQIA